MFASKYINIFAPVICVVIVYTECALARRKRAKENPRGNLGRDERRRKNKKKPKPELNV